MEPEHERLHRQFEYRCGLLHGLLIGLLIAVLLGIALC
jgi:hypothetical protein